MSDLSFHQTEQDDDVLAYEVSDEALERAVWNRSGAQIAVTAAFCSGLDTCPG